LHICLSVAYFSIYYIIYFYGDGARFSAGAGFSSGVKFFFGNLGSVLLRKARQIGPAKTVPGSFAIAALLLLPTQ